MLLYLYSFDGHLTHHDPKYFQRAKLGETGRGMNIKKTASEKQILKQVHKRIKQQDNAAVSEAAVILGYWFVDTPMESEVDAAIRDELIFKHGAVPTRDDKLKTEWLIIPRENQHERVQLVEEVIRNFEQGQLVEREIRKITLSDVQQEIVDAAEGYVKCQHKAGCGAGKTFVELYMMEKHVPAAKQVNIIAAPGIELLNQISEEFYYNTVVGLPMNGWTPIVVHSGKSTLPNVEATTDADEIARRIKNANPNKPIWVLAVYDSVNQAAAGIAAAGYTVHTKVIDEAHRTTGAARTKNQDILFLESDKQYAFSASQRIVRGVEGAFSQDDEDVYGPLLTNHPYREMVERGRVVDTKIHVVNSDADIWEDIEDADEVELYDETTGEHLVLSSDGQKALAGAMIATKTWFKQAVTAGIAKKALVFFNRKSDCERAISVDHPLSLIDKKTKGFMFHSGMSHRERKIAKDMFAAHKGPAMMTSVRAIREGVSINDADTAILLRGYGTGEEGISVELEQHHGRVVRTAPNKKFANVVVPLPPIGRANNIREATIRMVRDLLESLGILQDLIEVLERGDRITVGTLQDHNIVIHPSTPISIESIVDDINFTVVEYVKEFDKELADKLSERELIDLIDEL